MNRTPSWQPLREGVFELTWVASVSPEPGGRSHMVVPGEMNRYRTMLCGASGGEVVRGEPTLRVRTELEIGPRASPLDLAVRSRSNASC